MEREAPTHLFVSYSHHDGVAWKNELFRRPILSPCGMCRVWVDENGIEVGDLIDGRIERAIAESKVAVLLVTPEFLRSEYIRQTELPTIMNRVSDGDMEFVWVPIGVRAEDLREWPELVGTRAGVPVDRPMPIDIEGLSADERAEIVDRVRRSVESATDRVGARLKTILPWKYRLRQRLHAADPISVYEAFDDGLGRTVVLKVLSDPSKENLFDDAVRHAARLSDHRNFISIYGAWLGETPHFYVMNHVQGQNLVERMADRGRGLEANVVVEILGQVGEALLHAHALGIHHGAVRPSNILIDEDGDAYLSPLVRPRAVEARWLVREVASSGALDDRSFLLPEEFGVRQEAADPRLGDQYQLGLLGYFLLAGKLPDSLVEIDDSEHGFVSFQTPPDVSLLRRDCPRELAAALMRMIEPDPDDRFPDLEQALEEIGRGHAPDTKLRWARESYRRCLEATGELRDRHDFVTEFYTRLFALEPEIEAIFRAQGFGALPEGKRWRRHRDVLAQAVLLLFAFYDQEARRPEPSEPNVLTHTARSHRDLAIRPEWFDRFGEVLISVAADHDPHCAGSPGTRRELESSWARTLAPGLAYLRGRQENP